MSKLDERAEQYEFEWDYKEHESDNPPMPAFIPGKAENFKAGALWLLEEARKMVKEHENKFHPKPARWLLSGLEQLCEGEVKK